MKSIFSTVIYCLGFLILQLYISNWILDNSQDALMSVLYLCLMSLFGISIIITPFFDNLKRTISTIVSWIEIISIIPVNLAISFILTFTISLVSGSCSGFFDCDNFPELFYATAIFVLIFSSYMTFKSYKNRLIRQEKLTKSSRIGWVLIGAVTFLSAILSINAILKDNNLY